MEYKQPGLTGTGSLAFRSSAVSTNWESQAAVSNSQFAVQFAYTSPYGSASDKKRYLVGCGCRKPDRGFCHKKQQNLRCTHTNYQSYPYRSYHTRYTPADYHPLNRYNRYKVPGAAGSYSPGAGNSRYLLRWWSGL